ncbi:unnamed protein product [Staurois parvus]|uniref:Uncharacterized protein n=1 Tax=Staurois parvus TaxID=386267 RepID=A0ABN9CW85_9NEOB|nr:unnamed protein product [Staurois parvus]
MPISATYQCLLISATYQCPSVQPISAHHCSLISAHHSATHLCPAVHLPVPSSAHQCHPAVPHTCA